MPKPKLTILTDPVPFGFYLPIEFLKKILRKLKRLIISPPQYTISRYRGHPAVTRSLVEGLIQNNISANYNPEFFKDISDTVVVLSGVSALKQAIKLKQKGHITKLLAGPNLVELPSDFKGIIHSKEIDFCLTPSEWITTLYKKVSPQLEGRCLSWPAGVNTYYWKPNPKIPRKTILIYEKQRKGPVGPIDPYVNWLIKRGYKTEVIICGEYYPQQFLKLLQRSAMMIGFVKDETQGLAWAEAWSADVPTFIWKNTNNSMRGFSYKCSTAPYLNNKNGIFFNNFQDFKKHFIKWESGKFDFRPRNWVETNMSDKVCAAMLCKLASVS